MDVVDHVTSRETALQAVTWCVNMGHADALETLLSTHFKNEITIQEMSEELVNSLISITKSGNPDVLRTILRYVDDTCLQQSVSAEKSYVTKLLGHAVERGDTGMVDALLDRGGDPNSVYRGRPLLHLSLDGGSPEVARILVGGGASLSRVDKHGTSVLAAAISSSIADKESVVQWLIEAGADARSVTSSGKSILHIASLHSAAVIGLLVSQGSDVDVADVVNGDTPLHVACSQCCQETILKLIQCGCQFNLVNKNGETPLEKLLKFALDPTDFHSKTRKRVAKILMMNGFRLSVNDPRRRRDTKRGRDKVADLYSSLMKSMLRAPSLQVLCRPVIRGGVTGPKFHKHIEQLDIPCHLKDFLRFEDGDLRL